MPSSVRLTNRFAASALVVRGYLARTVAQTGKHIAAATRAQMAPGYFYETGLSRANTTWEQTSELGGQVHIATAYAAYPEFGTVHMAARPVLRPAIDAVWPDQLRRNWIAAPLLPPIDPPGPPGPAIDKDGNPL